MMPQKKSTRCSMFACLRRRARSKSPSYGVADKSPKIAHVHTVNSADGQRRIYRYMPPYGKDPMLISDPENPDKPLGERIAKPPPSRTTPISAYGVYTECELLACERLTDDRLCSQLMARRIAYQYPMSISTRHHYCRLLAAKLHEQAALLPSSSSSATPVTSPSALYPQVPTASQLPSEVMRTKAFSEPLEAVLLPSTSMDTLHRLIGQCHDDSTDLSTCYDLPNTQWREGNRRLSFNYILLDPQPLRIIWRSHKLGLTVQQQLALFAESVFYVGKGKKARPHQHLKDAIVAHERGANSASSSKIGRILQIWRRGDGVLSLHVFHNIMAVDAYSKEAAMIEALDVTNLTNIQTGDYYGVADAWPKDRRQRYGVYLLHAAMLHMLIDGHKPLRPNDIKDTA